LGIHETLGEEMSTAKGPLKTVALAVAGWLIMAAPIFGQKGPPPQDDPEVHYSFFVFMDGFAQWLDGRVQANPARRIKLMESASRYLKITPAELPTVIDACKTAVSELKAIEAQSQAYWRTEVQRLKAPDNVRAQQFAAMRQTAIHTGRVRLQQALSSASWSGLQAHINGEHRLRIQGR
jgi:hypothetical protein